MTSDNAPEPRVLVRHLPGPAGRALAAPATMRPVITHSHA